MRREGEGDREGNGGEKEKERERERDFTVSIVDTLCHCSQDTWQIVE